MEVIKPWEEEIYGYENHYNSRQNPKERFASLEKIISILRGFENGNEIKPINLIKYLSIEKEEKFAYDLEFPAFFGGCHVDGGHYRTLASIIGKHPLKINEVKEEFPINQKIPEEEKIDFSSMTIRATEGKLKLKDGRYYDFPKEIQNSKKIPGVYEISLLLEEGKNRRIFSKELINLYTN